MRSPILLAGCVAAACAAALALPAGPSSAAPEAPRAAATSFTGPQGTYHPVGPTRILDTRNGTGTGGHVAKLTGGHSLSLKVAGAGGLPTVGVGAVALNVTVVNETAAHGFLTVYPSGAALPTTSNINYVKGWTGANFVTVTVPSSGIIDFYDNVGSLDVVADVAGWYANTASTAAAGDQFVEVAPQRLLDTRSLGTSPLNPVGPGTEVFQPVDYSGTEPNSHVKALAVTITAVDEGAGGHLTAWSGTNPNSPPTTSTLNFTAGVITPNLAIVPVAPCPSNICPAASAGLPAIAVQNVSSKSVQIIIDIWGYFDDGTYAQGLRYKPRAAPLRIVDTRIGQGTTKLGAQTTHVVTAPSTVADADTIMLVSNATVIEPTAATYVVFWPDDGLSKPVASNLNPRVGRNIATGVITGVGSTNAFNAYNNAGAINFAYDVSGTFEAVSSSNVAHTTKAEQATGAARAVVLPVARLSAPGVRSN